MSVPSGSPDAFRRISTLAWLTGAGLLALALVVTLALTNHPSRSGRASSGAPSTTALGEVSGIASPCVGVATLASFEARPVHVQLQRGSRVVSSETVTGDHRFLLAATPGRYVLTSDQYQRPTYFGVVLHRLETVQVNLPVFCK
jgi:hypothetical protein